MGHKLIYFIFSQFSHSVHDVWLLWCLVITGGLPYVDQLSVLSTTEGEPGV